MLRDESVELDNQIVELHKKIDSAQTGKTILTAKDLSEGMILLMKLIDLDKVIEKDELDGVSKKLGQLHLNMSLVKIGREVPDINLIGDLVIDIFELLKIKEEKKEKKILKEEHHKK